MKASELMIGDWVHDTRETFNNPVKLTGINAHQINESDPICFLENEEGLGLTRRLSELKPIPLTVEILEKNGFTRERWRRDDNSLVITYELDYDIYIELFDYQFRLVHNLEDDPDFGYSADVLVEINFVHQLQHLIKDLEIEEEVIL